MAQGHADLGNIANDGFGGRQILISQVSAGDPLDGYRFFPPHDVLPDQLPPTPATPAQDAVTLTEHTPLKVAIPQLAHLPWGANVEVSHFRSDQEITINAMIEHLPWGTDTIYGPHEYLYPIGPLPSGDYRLILNLTQTGFSGGFSTSSGFIDFNVARIPEPGAISLVCLAGVAGAVIRSSRLTRRCS